MTLKRQWTQLEQNNKTELKATAVAAADKNIIHKYLTMCVYVYWRVCAVENLAGRSVRNSNVE